MSVKLGIIGCGYISEIYLRNLSLLTGVEVAAVADADMKHAQSRGDAFGIPALSVKGLLDHPEIEIVLNLTIPRAHAEVATAVLEAGKSVYNEKPLAIERAEARAMLALARDNGLRVGCAPDTFLGAGLQTCRQLIDAGAIGEPVGATAFMTCRGHEYWHPNPAFYYQPGGGPMFDMGPYYLTALVALIGPVRRVTGSARISFPERTITSEPKFGSKISVEVATNIATVADFADGAIGTMIMSFDVWQANLPKIEIYGSEVRLEFPIRTCLRDRSSCGSTSLANGERCRWPASLSRTGEDWAWRIWLTPSGTDAPIAPTAAWPITCWISCMPCTMHRAKDVMSN